ncbi:hypothetical protein JKP88DRAFT_266901 [Tribonema minus]|uniref:Uncharacterized protein n=1 Tax=Tribonema minus TaxID=303371 RepID=A0A835ZBE4_9STRA|nr:hypothetical protein JKP88DRAFT_266901 [Tribonema minus]
MSENIDDEGQRLVGSYVDSHFRCAATARIIADNLARGGANIFTAYTLLHVERARVDAIDLSSPPAPMYVSMGRAMSVKLYRRERRRGSGVCEVEDEGGAHEGGPINIAAVVGVIHDWRLSVADLEPWRKRSLRAGVVLLSTGDDNSVSSALQHVEEREQRFSILFHFWPHFSSHVHHGGGIARQQNEPGSAASALRSHRQHCKVCGVRCCLARVCSSMSRCGLGSLAVLAPPGLRPLCKDSPPYFSQTVRHLAADGCRLHDSRYLCMHGMGCQQCVTLEAE